MTTVMRMEAPEGIPVAVDTLEAFRGSVGVGISIRGGGGVAGAPGSFLRPVRSL